jgi:histone acetyltransferase 1
LTPIPIVAALYKAIYEYVLTRPSVSELTVEDPAEAFEDLRDRVDLAMLMGHAAFMTEGFGSGAVSHGGGRVGRTRTTAREKGKKGQAGGKLGPPADRAWLERWRKELKIAGVRIFLFQSFMPPYYLSDLFHVASVPPARGDAHSDAPEPHRYAFCQSLQATGEGAVVPLQLCECSLPLCVMGFVDWFAAYTQEVLAQLEEKERLEKLEETFQSVCEDYRRILAMLR